MQGQGVEEKSLYLHLHFTVNLKLLKKKKKKGLKESFIPTELSLFDLSGRSLEKPISRAYLNLI